MTIEFSTIGTTEGIVPIIKTIISHPINHNALKDKKFKAKKINYNKNPVIREKDASYDKDTQIITDKPNSGLLSTRYRY